MNKIITVTKSFLPSKEALNKYIDRIYVTNWLTNYGSLENELTERLKKFLNVDNLLLVNNGSLALQVLYRVLGIKNEVITTPFSFVATTSTLAWEGLMPKFVDIDPSSFNLDYRLIEQNITSNTSAILPVHVFGRACNVWEIDKIAQKYNLTVIYDAAHAFNVTTNENRNILTYGDASILSFHATKLFHTIEGGAIIVKDETLIKECKKLSNFGITGYDQIDGIGTNCKMNEFSAAMGLAVLDNINFIMEQRQRVSERYNKLINPIVIPDQVMLASVNYSYYPILLKNENQCLKVKDNLIANDIMPRRYFYPSLNTLNYIKYQPCPFSENIAQRILCLPMYPTLENENIEKICNIVNHSLKPEN